MSNPIGFNRNIDRNIKNEEKNIRREFKELEEIHKSIIEEQSKAHKVSDMMMREITRLKDLENNLENIKRQEGSLRKFLEHKAQLIQKYHDGSNKESMNLEELQQVINTLRRLEPEITNLYDYIVKEIQRLIIDETHDLYKESEHNAKMMKQISRDARDMRAELNKLLNKHFISNKELMNAEKEIAILQQQREQKRQQDERTPVGFK